MSNIKVYIDHRWKNARSYQKEAYEEFKKLEEHGSLGLISYNYNKDGIKLKIERVLYNETNIRNINCFGSPYLFNERGEKTPIIDFNNIYVFLPEINVMEGNNWHKARNYQSYAYVNFLYDNKIKKIYKSNPRSSEGELIQLNNLNPNIKFSMSRNSNNSIYYERNYGSRTRVRISDCKFARDEYQEFFNRMTSPITSASPEPESLIDTIDIEEIDTIDNIEEIGTDNEEEQCCICYDIKQNIKFIPCNHTHTCSKCYNSLSKKECPICKTPISNIIKI